MAIPDAPLRTKDPYNSSWKLLDFLAANEDHSSDLVWQFLHNLPSAYADVVEPLMDGKSRLSVCRRLGLKRGELESLLQEVGEDYRDFCINNIF